MRRLVSHALITWLAALAVGPLHAADSDTTTPISVKAVKNGESVIVDAEFSVAVPPRQAWEVLTDFGHMANFITNVKLSNITEHHGNHLRVAQQGSARHGPLHFDFDSIREIELTPIEKIVSHVVSGSVKKLDGTTLVTADGAGTHVVYHAESIPNTYVPPILGPSFIENETRHQFEEMRGEMLRRKAAP
ncbi:MAG: SRPBCC family protein [Pseudomonadota bacterium]|nr:SRPBCC family protein [Pseudomonadota bacterium]